MILLYDTPRYDHPKCTGSIGPVHSCVAKNIGSCLHSVDVAAPAGEWLRSPQRPAGRVVHVQTSGLIASRSSWPTWVLAKLEVGLECALAVRRRISRTVETEELQNSEFLQITSEKHGRHIRATSILALAGFSVHPPERPPGPPL
jgi:hypothetical protein